MKFNTYAMPAISEEAVERILEALDEIPPALVMPIDQNGRMLDADGNVIPWSKLPTKPLETSSSD